MPFAPLPVTPGSDRAAALQVSVIVPHFRDLAGLDLCLTHLERQTLPRAAFEIVVADNNSPEGEAAVAAVIAGRARLTIVDEPGAGPARNGGVAQSTGRILAFTDSDCQPEPNWLAEGLKALEGVDIVGGAMRVLVHDAANVSPEEAFELIFAFDNQTYVEKKGFTVSANLFCRRGLFDSVGGFLAKGISEDLEWCLRAGGLGYRIAYAPNCRVGHPARRTWADTLKKWRRINVETFGLTRRRPAGRLRWLLKTLALPLSAVAHTPKVLFHQGLATGQRLGALGVLYRLRLWRFADSLRLLFAGV